MAPTLTPERLLQIVCEKRARLRGRALVAFWFQVTADRDAFARRLREAAGATPVVPLVLRKGFENDNSVMTDLRRLIEQNQEWFTAPHFPTPPWELPVALVLLSRKPLTVGQCTSSAVLPSWFPVQGGDEVVVQIEDLFWTATGPMDVEEARTGELCAALYDLDRALVRRWTDGRMADATRGDAFFALIQDPARARAPETADEFLRRADEHLRREVLHAAGFRPGARPDAPSLVGRLARLASRTSRDDLLRPAADLADALALPATLDPPADSLVTVLSRSTNAVPDLRVRFARNLIMTVYAATQFVNAKSHSDRAPDFPISLLQSFSDNLRQTLEQMVQRLG